ncbi:hypothetical protein Btru_020518 [Bulinus truncatus]|nr:hypothetical protein Btru_020518 [Bulinus truncatus]
MVLARYPIMSLLPMKIMFILKSALWLAVVIIMFKSLSQPLNRNWHRTNIAIAYRSLLANQNQGRLATDGGQQKDMAKREWENKTYSYDRVEIEDQEEVNGQTENFQAVNHNEAWVYSAFYDIDVDAPGQELIRVFGISTYERFEVHCLFTEDGLMERVNGWREFISDNHLEKNSAVMLFCPLKAGSRPQFVSIHFEKRLQPTNNLTIVYPSRKKRTLTVCHSVIYNTSDHRQLVQSIEMNRLLGTDHIYIYNHSATDKANRALRHYQRQGLVTVMSWSIPTSQVWYLGQNMAINDCVFRNRGVSTYVAILDRDEVVVPRQHQSLIEVLEAADHGIKVRNKGRRNKTLIGSYVFQTSIFSKEPSRVHWEKVKKKFSISSEEERFMRENSVSFLTRIVRMSNIFPHMVRSKTIVRPEHILVAGIHFTHFHRGKATFAAVSEKLAIVHHYKSCEKGQVLDTTALKFKKRLITRLKTALAHFL